MPATIIETSDNRIFSVRETGDPELAHVWFGYEVKRLKGEYVRRKRAPEILVRKAGCKIVNGTYDTVADFGRALAEVGGYA